jgi:hypothetical protein
MTALPAQNYLNNGARNNAEMKQAFEDVRSVVAELLGGGVETTLVLNATAITPLANAAHCISIDTQGGAGTDNCANIIQTNTVDGSLLLVRNANAARTVVLKNAAGGAGQLNLLNGADFALKDTKTWVLLKRTGALWEEVLRSGRASQSFKGAAVASVASTNIWSTDGDVIHITGAVTITDFGQAPYPGAKKRLIFDSTPQVNYNAAKIVWPNGQNRVMVAGDIVDVVADDAANPSKCLPMLQGNVGLLSFFESAEQAIAAAFANVNVAHGLGAVPKLFHIVIRCKTAELNWAVGDEIVLANDDDSANDRCPWVSATNIGFTYGSVPLVNNKSTGGRNSITAANWKFVFRGWL